MGRFNKKEGRKKSFFSTRKEGEFGFRMGIPAVIGAIGGVSALGSGSN